MTTAGATRALVVDVNEEQAIEEETIEDDVIASVVDVEHVEHVEHVELPTNAARVVLASGRRYDVDAGEDDVDRVVVRGRGGEVLLRIEVTERGPVLAFSSAEIELSATRRLTLDAGEIAVRSRGALRVDVAGDRHARIAGAERVEAARVELQANEAGVAVRAMEAIRLDGEHIGLNDDPAPKPFAWSAIAEGGKS
jgi:hypothetical protein